MTCNVYLPHAKLLPALHREKRWDLSLTLKEGEHVSGGDVWGRVAEDSLLNEFRGLMLHTPVALSRFQRTANIQLQDRCLVKKRKNNDDTNIPYPCSLTGQRVEACLLSGTS